MITEVVEVGAVEHDRQPAPCRLGGADHEEVVLAEVAPVRRVLGVAGDRQLVRVHDQVLDAHGGGEHACLLEVVGGRGRRDGGERQAARPEHLVRDAQEERGVHPARERHQRGLEAPEQAPQAAQLLVERHLRSLQIPSAWKSLVVR